ncbi:MAG: ethanolamine utilization microcompartment protein EutL [Myxococcales bacterium]|nr:ethanolamine utilization microcompartment protein EutL [Myxococcales bacterium]
MPRPHWLAADLVALPAKLLSCRLIPNADAALLARLGAPAARTALGLVTCDQDDSTYAALDQATKHADVEIVYAKSFYAGAAHASGPLSGEVLGVLAGPDPDEVLEGLAAFRRYLEESACFYQVPGPAGGARPAFFPHVLAETGRYLAPLAGIEVGAPLAYLIAPPVESVVAVDAALKAADVRLCHWFGPPTETNFGGAYLAGDLAAVEAAAAAFAEAVADVARRPLDAARRAAAARG